MMYGHVEQPDDIIDHWEAVRDLQDEHRGFTAFVPWSFKPGNTLLEKWIKTYKGPSTYLRMLAASLFEENVHAAADYVNKTTVDEIISLIRDAGYTPAQRTTEYQILREY